METEYNPQANPKLNLTRLLKEINTREDTRQFGFDTPEAVISKIIFASVFRADARGDGLQSAIDALPESIIIKRTSAEISTTVIADGVFAWATDTKTLSIGDGVTPGGISVGSGGEGLEECKAASTADIDITANAPATIDGVTLDSGDLVLLKNQTDAFENGIRVFLGTSQPLGRSSEYDENTDYSDKGLVFFVSGGTLNGNRLYSTTNDSSFVLDTDNLVFAETTAVFASLTQYVANDYTDFEVGSAAEVDTVKKALDKTSEVLSAKIRENDNDGVFAELNTRLVRNNENGTIWLVVGDGATSIKYRFDTLLHAMSGNIPGATPDQVLRPHVSSPEGGGISVEKVVINGIPVWLQYIIPGDDSDPIEVTRVIVDTVEGFDLELQDIANFLGLGTSEMISWITGHSDSKGANGRPLSQGLQKVIPGAMPPAQILDLGGEGAVSGQKFDRVDKVGKLKSFLTTQEEVDARPNMHVSEALHNTRTNLLKVADETPLANSVVANAGSNDGGNQEFTVSLGHNFVAGDHISNMSSSSLGFDLIVLSTASVSKFTANVDYEASLGVPITFAKDARATTIGGGKVIKETNSSRKVSLGDEGGYVYADSASDFVISLSKLNNEPYPMGYAVECVNTGTGGVSLSHEAGVTVEYLTTMGSLKAMRAIQIEPNLWHVVGS